MGQSIDLKARDGHQLEAYLTRPEAEVKGAVVVVHEIFGVNPYIRRVVDGFARDGYVTIAPALFDRIERDVQLGYEGEDLQKAFGFYQKLDPKTAILDIAAAFQHVQAQATKVGVVGYCFGGLMSWISATRGKDAGFLPACTVGYYAGGVGGVAQEELLCPVMLHFGAVDTHIGTDQVDAVRQAHPEVEIFIYEDAGHGFSCDARASFNAGAAAQARERTLRFLEQHIG